MKHLNWMAGVLSGLCLAGCVSLSPTVQAQFSQIVFAALTRSPDALQSAADAGDGHAQLSYALVLQYGLNGATPDDGQAGYYRQMATAARGSTTSAVYVPGYRKAPGHTQLITMPQYDVTEREAQSAQACAELLAEGAEGRDVANKTESGVCGGPQNYARLAGLWQRARSQR